MYIEKQFDVFLSYERHDNQTVEYIAQRLEGEANLKPWLDKWNLIPGEPWQEALEQALDVSRTCAVFIGPSGIGTWENEEMRSAIDTRVRQADFRVIPVLLPGATLPERGKLPRFLSRLTWVDFRTGLDDDEPFRRLVAGIRGSAPGRDAQSTLGHLNLECPYRGLEVFDETHARFFFGREALTQHLIEALRPTCFLAVLGPSGSGKSSLVRAGLIPKLKAGALPLGGQWLYLIIRPGAHPLQELATRLAFVAGNNDVLQILNGLEADERSLHLQSRLLLTGRSKETRVFIFVDQFEELLTLCRDEDERRRFINNIRYASTAAGGQITVVITMRADFLARAAEYTDLAEMLSGHQFIISPMDDTDLRRVIEDPARLVGLDIENGLTERILKDVGHEPGILPLLEDTLLQLCEKRRSDNVMTLQAYEESGGVHGTLAKRADEIFGQLTPKQQTLTQRILLRLTQPGEGTEDTRRRVKVNELLGTAIEQPCVEEVIELLTNARLLTTSTNSNGERQVDVAHEALIRGWPRLHRWIDENRVALRLHRRLTEAAQEWKERKRDVSFLYRGTRLTQATEWREQNVEALNVLEREFLDASVEMQSREQAAVRWRRRVLVGVLVFVFILISALAIRWYQEQRIAFSRELAATAKTQMLNDPQLSMLLAIEAIQIAYTDEAEDALRQSLVQPYETARMTDHTGWIETAAFSPDGKRIVTASYDNTARLWDTETGRSLMELRGHTDAVYSAVYSPDGKRIVTVSSDDTGRVWDAETGQSLVELRGHPNFDSSVEFSPDGKRIITASENMAQVWDTETGRLLANLRGHTDVVFGGSFSPDGRRIVTAGRDAPRLWDAETWRYLAVLRGHTQIVVTAAFSPDSKRIVTASYDNTARLWDAMTGRSLGVLRGHTEYVNDAAFSPDGTLIVTASSDDTARVWDAETGQSRAELRGHTDLVRSAAFSRDGRRVITVSNDNTARVWDAETGRSLAELRGPQGSPEEQRKRALEAELKRIEKLPKDQQVTELMRGASLIADTVLMYDAAFSPDGKRVVTASGDDMARVWDAETGQILAELSGHTEYLLRAVFSPDGKFIVTASNDKTARIWDAQTGKSLAELRGHTLSVDSAAFSPDGKRIVTSSDDATARVWDTATGQSLAILNGHTKFVNSSVFSPDGKFIVTAGSDNMARIWDVRTGLSLAILHGHTDAVNSAAFSLDGRWIITASDDNTAQVFACDVCGSIDDLLGQASKRRKRDLTLAERQTYLHERWKK
jgi:WD40 repeat protein/energy-coupling factor transporter ATP-binding protein EcfA2